MQDSIVWLDVTISAVYIFCLIYAALLDFRKLFIPNWITLALTGLFFVYALAARPDIDILLHVLCAFGFLVVIGIVLFSTGWMSGGDVKLLTAVILWAGPKNTLLALLIVTSVGLVLALVIMALRWLIRRSPRSALARALPTWVKLGICPYGIAISIGALMLMPYLF
jgi:prepilin peptidase CpaA